jgi:hypothetical protein
MKAQCATYYGLILMKEWVILFLVFSIEGFEISPRGAGYVFGEDITKKFN